MSLAPLLAAPAVVQFHALAALAALLIGIVQLLAPKGSLPHRQVGWAWVLLMLAVAISSFWITSASRGHRYSYVHLVSVGVLILLPLGVVMARRRNIRRHGRIMASVFCGGLIIAGGFTMMPGRIMGAVVFGW